ncbi:MAG: hypothetical protein AABX38_06195 [Candidatus Micrarchaeota archaeon]
MISEPQNQAWNYTSVNDSLVKLGLKCSELAKSSNNGINLNKLLSIVLATNEFENAVCEMEIFRNIGEPRGITTTICLNIFNQVNSNANVTIESLVNETILDLRGLPTEKFSKVRVRGLALGINQFNLTEDILFLKFNETDIQVEDFQTGYEYMELLCDSICEIKFKLIQFIELQHKIESIFQILRLFRPHPIHWKFYNLKSKSLFNHSSGTLRNIKYLSQEPKLIVNDLNKEEISKFYAFFKEHELDQRLLNTSNNHIDIALNRYEKAVLANEIVEEKITNAVSGLEALYLIERDELVYRFGLRISKVMSIFDYEHLETIKKLKTAYTIRSEFIHGQLSKEDKLEDILNFTLECLRKSIIVFLVLEKNGYKKEALIKKIEHGFVDKKISQELIDEIQKLTDELKFNLQQDYNVIKSNYNLQVIK